MTRRAALSPVETALVRAFCPGEVSTLRSIRSREWESLTFSGHRVTIEFDLSSAAARKLAFEIAATAPDIEFAVPNAIVADVDATVRGDVLTVEALVVAD